MLLAVAKMGYLLSYADENLKNDHAVVLAAVTSRGLSTSKYISL